MFFEDNRLRAFATTTRNPSPHARGEGHARAAEVFIAVMTSFAATRSRL